MLFMVFASWDSPERWFVWGASVFAIPLVLLLVRLGWWIVRLECGRWTHYPIRLNRKTGMVHVFRQNGTVLSAPWRELFITLGKATAAMNMETFDLRAHVLDSDGKTVRETFTLGYTNPAYENSMDKFWNFIQTYMEDGDGVERTYADLKTSVLMPVDGRREGWRWSIFRTFAPGLPYPWTWVLACIPFSLTVCGRIVAMWTSRIPRWPQEIEDVNVIEPDDPYVLTWRDNFKLGWWELYLPMLFMIPGLGLPAWLLICLFNS